VDACAAVRAPGVADDCTHQAMLVLWLLRGGDPAALAARAAATPRDCDWRWLASFPEAHDVKQEPVVTGARLERDSGAAPELNPRDPAAVRVDVDLSSEVEEVLSFWPAPAVAGMPRRGQTAFRSAPAEALPAELAKYARVSPLPGPADLGEVTLLHEVAEGQLEGGGMHGHMVVYYYSRDTGPVFLDSSRGPGQRLPRWAELLGVGGYRTDCAPYCGVWLRPSSRPDRTRAAAAPPPGTVVHDLAGEMRGERGGEPEIHRVDPEFGST
jgi:hypothetical protein